MTRGGELPSPRFSGSERLLRFSWEPFVLRPVATALPARVERQLRDASLVGGPVVLFSLFDYADPRKGGARKEMYDLIVEWNSQFPATESSASTGSSAP